MKEFNSKSKPFKIIMKIATYIIIFMEKEYHSSVIFCKRKQPNDND